MKLTASARVRRSPYFHASQRAGACRYTVYNRMYMPTSYGDPVGEYWAIRNGVTMWDVAIERQIVISGPDAQHLVQYLSPRDVSASQIGQGLYVPLCNHDGYVINDPVLLKIDDSTFWLSIADSEILLWARAIAGERQLNVKIYEGDISPLAIQGPKSDLVMARLFDGRLPKLRYFGFCRLDLGDIPLIVARSGWSKQGGYELYLMDQRHAEALWQHVADAGAEFGIRPANPNGSERIESGLVSYGGDTDDHTTPFELGLGRWCELDRSDDFLGKQALIHHAKKPVARRISGLVLDGEPVDAVHCRVPISGTRDDCFVSGTAYSPRFERAIAIGLVDGNLSAGARVNIEFDGGGRMATLVDLPMDLDVKNSGPKL